MRMLITGASGLLGANVALEAAALGHEVYGAANRAPLTTQDFKVLTANLLEAREVRQLFEHTRPDWVIHCAALADLEACEKDPETARRINTETPGILAEICRKGGARMLHVSTDAVFDGQKGRYTEDDAPNPQNVYAQTKLDGEIRVAQTNPDAIIARVNLFGYSIRGSRSLAEFFLYGLQKGQALKGFTDVYFCPLLVNDIAPLFFKMLDRGLAGLYHTFSADCLSKYDFGLRIAARFGLDGDLIAPVSVASGGLVAKRSANLTMDSTRLSTALGEPLPRFSPMLARFYTLYQQGYPQKLRRMAGDDH